MADAVVLIHAFPMDASMWAPQIGAFGSDVKVVAPSLPGFGGEPGVGDVMEMSVAADHVATAMAQAGVSRAVICGLSMGGYVALALHRQYPELVAALVLANTKAEGDDEAGRERRQQLASRLKAEGSEFLVESPPPLLSEGAHPAIRRLVRNIIAAQPAASIAAASMGMAARPDSTPGLADITVPTVVISSFGDTLIPASATKPLSEGIAGAHFDVIETAGHLSNLEAPQEFNRILTAAVARA
jgi:3-oxoadipate enol-lactonase